jgi:HSP20 family protein
MTLIRYEPWNLMNRLHREIDSVFGDAFATPAADSQAAVSWAPSVDVREDADRFTVHADLPGVEAKDVQITADNGTLTIRGERRFQKQEGKRGFERLERVEGSFLRRFTLPDNVRAEEIKARHNNGVLEIVIPKQAAPEPRRINVEVN